MRTNRNGSVILKNETVIRPVCGFPRDTGGVLPPSSRPGATAAHGTSLALIEWIGFYRMVLFTCMGPPLTESPGRCQVFERMHTWSPIRTNTTVCRALRRVLERITQSHAEGIGCRHNRTLMLRAFQERTAPQGLEIVDIYSSGEEQGDITSRVTGCPMQDRTSFKADATATPFAPRRSPDRRSG